MASRGDLQEDRQSHDEETGEIACDESGTFMTSGSKLAASPLTPRGTTSARSDSPIVLFPMKMMVAIVHQYRADSSRDPIEDGMTERPTNPKVVLSMSKGPG